MTISRTSLWPVSTVLLVCVGVVVVGCNSRTDSITPTAVKTAVLPPPKKSTKLIADWPKPDAALVISGQMDGYLEPCGCSEGQKGGLPRRYDLVEKLKKQGWSLALLDLGSLTKDPGSARGGFEQAKTKFSVALRALSMMGYNAIGLSAEDLKFGIGDTLGQYLNLNEPTKIVCGNVRPKEESGFQSAVQAWQLLERGTVKIGITSVLEPEMLTTLEDPDKSLLDVKPAQDVLPEILVEMEKQSTVQVLMVQGSAEAAKRLAKAYPAFEIVVATSTFADPEAEPEKFNNGKTLIIQVGKKGMHVGVIGIYAGQQPPFRYQRVTLGKTYQTAEPIRKLLDEDFQAELRNLGVVENFVRRNYVNGAAGATFLGAETCRDCHPITYAKWHGTKHAHAYDSLFANPQRDRRHDAECITCHTTGFEYNSGWVSAEKTPHLMGNQCENCHGPGSKHAQEPDNAEYRKLLTVATTDVQKSNLCQRCHDEDNSPKFKFETFMPQISHKGMDRYDRPEVHVGIKPKVVGSDNNAAPR